MKGPPRMLNEPKKERNAWSVLCSVLLCLLFVFLLFELWFTRFYIPVCIDGTSMCNTLQDGDWVYSRSDTEPKRGDIVTVYVKDLKNGNGTEIFREWDDTAKRYVVIETIIKRLIGVEGDAVKCEKGVVYRRNAGEEEFVALDEPYALGVCNDFGEVTVGEGEVFVLGDNRVWSHDSSDEGPLKAPVTGVVAEWSLKHKHTVTVWENFRQNLREFFANPGKLFSGK